MKETEISSERDRKGKCERQEEMREERVRSINRVG